MQKGFAVLSILVGVLLGIILLVVAAMVVIQTFFVNPPYMPSISVNPQVSPTSVSQATSILDETANWKTYTNGTAKFFVKYPPKMVYTEKTYTEKLKRLVFEGEEGTVEIEYALVGEQTAWGGGCDPEMIIKINFSGRETEVCLWNGNLGFHASHPDKIADFNIKARFSEENKEKILKILSTFKFTQ